jgi:diguanylate cyclase (GGDEF)-like protein
MENSPPCPPSDTTTDCLTNPQELLAQLQTENQQLQQKLQDVTAIAAANETIWRHFLEIERILFCTHRFDLLVEELLKEIKQRFEIDWALLVLTHPDVLERFFPDLPDEGEIYDVGARVLAVHWDDLADAIDDLTRPLLISGDTVQISPWLPIEAQDTLQSGVWIPLTIHEIVFGALLLGSHNAERYQAGDSTDLLEQLGIKIALCMENCLSYERMKDLTLLDPLTGLVNLFQLQGMLELEFRKAYRHGTPLALLLVDLDSFQQINHSFGQDTAVSILQHAANLLQRVCREGDLVGRYGSGEFLVLLPGADEDTVAFLAETFQQVLRKSPFTYQNTAILLQATIGWASLGETMERAYDLLIAASTELYRAKLARPSRYAPPPADSCEQ